MTRLCEWLKDGMDFDSGMALADAIGVSQSSISGHLSKNEKAAIPKDELKEVYANFLNKITVKGMSCNKWSIAEFTNYLDSDMEPNAFIKWLENKPIPFRLPVREIYLSLTNAERIEIVEIFFSDLKENLCK